MTSDVRQDTLTMARIYSDHEISCTTSIHLLILHILLIIAALFEQIEPIVVNVNNGTETPSSFI